MLQETCIFSQAFSNLDNASGSAAFATLAESSCYSPPPLPVLHETDTMPIGASMQIEDKAPPESMAEMVASSSDATPCNSTRVVSQERTTVANAILSNLPVITPKEVIPRYRHVGASVKKRKKSKRGGRSTEQRHKRAKISEEDRRMIVETHLNTNASITQTATRFGVPIGSLQEWLSLHAANGDSSEAEREQNADAVDAVDEVRNVGILHSKKLP